MEKAVKIIGTLKWACFPLGYIMYAFTQESFGSTIAGLLSVISIITFWVMMRNEQTRLIGQTIARDIKEAILQTGDVDNFIEIKRLKRGIIARVYLINAKDRVAVVHKAINSKMEVCKFKKYLWIMQLTDMSGKNALKETQRLLNDQLLEEIMNKHKGDKK